MVDERTSKRQVAHKVRIADIVDNPYVKEEGWLPNYIAVGDKKVSRVNLLGVIVSRSSKEDGVVSQDFVLDDGSGRVSLRFFESGVNMAVGDIVTVIGRPREFGAERYIVPEIMRKVENNKWVELRRLEMVIEQHRNMHGNPVQQAGVSAQSGVVVGSDESLSVETEEFVDDANPATDLINIIRKLDSGLGVGFEEITAEFKGDSDSFVKRLLEQGDIFEVKPGRYKVLE